MNWVGFAAALLLGVLMACATPAILRRLPPPVGANDEPDAGAGDPEVEALAGLLAVVAAGQSSTNRPPTGAAGGGFPPTPYIPLARAGFAAKVGAAVALAGVIAAWRDPTRWWLWLPLSTVGVLSVAIDAAITYLPLRLAQVSWVLAAASVAGACIVGGDAWPAVRAVAGAAIAGGLFAILWRWFGVGFGDVRLMATVGALAGASSWGMLLAAVFCGTAAGALWGLVARLVAGNRAFAYGPGLLAGPFLALVLIGT